MSRGDCVPGVARCGHPRDPAHSRIPYRGDTPPEDGTCRSCGAPGQACPCPSRDERSNSVMTSESLAAALARAESPVELLRNLAFPPSTFPVQPEFTNWRSEQRSWLDTCALLDQSHHMHD